MSDPELPLSIRVFLDRCYRSGVSVKAAATYLFRKGMDAAASDPHFAAGVKAACEGVDTTIDQNLVISPPQAPREVIKAARDTLRLLDSKIASAEDPLVRTALVRRRDGVQRSLNDLIEAS